MISTTNYRMMTLSYPRDTSPSRKLAAKFAMKLNSRFYDPHMCYHTTPLIIIATLTSLSLSTITTVASYHHCLFTISTNESIVNNVK